MSIGYNALSFFTVPYLSLIHILKHVLGVGYAVAPVGADHMMNVHDTDFTYDGDGLRRVNLALPPEQQVGPLPAQSISEAKLRVFYNELNWMHFQDLSLIHI